MYAASKKNDMPLAPVFIPEARVVHSRIQQEARKRGPVVINSNVVIQKEVLVKDGEAIKKN